MATGPEHYREAERLLAGQPINDEDRAQGIESNGHWPPTHMELLAAQAHATLAHAAAIAMAAPVDQEADSGMPPADARAWHAACSADA